MAVVRRHAVSLVAIAASLWCASALADPPPPSALDDRSLAAGCAACHGTDGRPLPGSPVPAIAGLGRDRIRDDMQAFKHGTRGGTVMPQLAKGYDDAQIERLAAFFAAQKSMTTR